MPTTTNYGWTTPADTDLVKDGAAAIRTLGSSIDTSVKSLNAGTTAGDLDYYTSSTAKARIGIGSTGQVLTVSGGVPSWSTPASPSLTSASATVATSQTTTSASYTDLATAGPAVTLTTGTKALVIVNAGVVVGTADRGYASFAVSGATTIAASDASAIYQEGSTTQRGSAATRLTTLTAGSNTFTMKYRASGGGTLTADNRTIIVIDLGS